MKTFSKLMILIVTLTVLVSLFGCAPAATPTAAPTTPQEQPTTPPEPTDTAAPTDAPMPTEAVREDVTLRYANWNLGTEEENNIQRQLVKAYTDLNPNVTVEFVDMSAEGGWEANLTSYAAKGELPDVFMANNVPLYVQNGWLADLTDLVTDDPAWGNISQNLRDSFTYSGTVYGLPAAQFIMGYFVNQDLFEAANLDYPEYGVSVEDFFDATTQVTNVSKGILGIDEVEPIMGWYPSTQDDSLLWFGFDGEGMNYNSGAFKDAVAKAAEMTSYAWQGLTDEQKKNFKSQGPWELFLNQEVGAKWEASWAMPDMVQNASFNWDFVGIPGGNQALVADVMVVSKTAKNLEEAFNFARWMTYSPEAYAKEAELAEAAGSAPKLPVAADDESIALFKTFIDKPGVNQALENLDSSLVESLAKAIPGYIAARWEGKPGIDIGEDKDVNIAYMISNAITGKFKFEDYAANLEEFANTNIAEARAALNK